MAKPKTTDTTAPADTSVTVTSKDGEYEVYPTLTRSGRKTTAKRKKKR